MRCMAYVLILALCFGVLSPELWVGRSGRVYAHKAVYPHDEFIVPGERIGALRIGMPISSALIVLRSYGKVSQKSPTVYCAEKTNPHFFRICFGQGWRFGDDDRPTQTLGYVYWVGTESGQVMTRNGLGPGDRQAKWDGRYGPPQWEDFWWSEWWYRGLVIRWTMFVFADIVIVVPKQSDRLPEYPTEGD